jgi:hypothetical protein
MGPVATKLARDLRRTARKPVIDLAAMRDLQQMQREIAGSADETSPLPPNHAAWMHVFKVLGSLAHLALSTSALRKLADRVAAADDEYMPGGPPQSPILDSFFTSWWMADLTVGPVRESMCSVLADVGPALGMPAEVCRYARLLGQSRMGVYRMTDLGDDRVELVELVTDSRVTARLPSDLHGRGELWLTRLLPPIVEGDGDWVVWTTPYRLDGPKCLAQWLAYCERVVGTAVPADRTERIARHFKASDEPRRWSEFVMNGYAGVTDIGEIVLCGVPDRPKTLPQHPDYDEVSAGDPDGNATPQQRLRIRLHALADQQRLSSTAPEVTAVETTEGQRFAELHRLMSLAYKMYGQLDREGKSAIDRLQLSASELPAEEQRELQALAAGWFSAFEILRIRVDEGMEVRDLLEERTLWISERSATRQVDRGDLIAGWVLVEGERLTLDGALCHVPARVSAAFIAGLRKARDELKAKRPELDWKKRNGSLACRAAPLLEAVFAAAPSPTLVNHDGDKILFSSARYDVVDSVRVQQLLEERFHRTNDGAYEHVIDEVVVARVVPRDRTLQLECNSKRRLTRMKAMLKKAFGTALRHRADTFEDLEPLLDDAPSSQGRAPEQTELSLPVEAQAQIQAMMLQRMRDWLDERIPALGGKTPREAARSQRGRDDVVHMLVRQQQIFAAGPGLPPVDLQEIWKELGLQPRA